MRLNISEIVRRVDWWLIGTIVLLLGLGLLLIYSLTWPEDNRLVKQIGFIAFGLVLMMIVQMFDVHFWRNASIAFYIITLILLVGLIIFGDATRGARGWIPIGPLMLQPAEFAKLTTILFLATTLERLHFDLATLRDLLAALGIVALPVALVLAQPDFGSAFIILVAGGIMILYVGLDAKKLLALAFIGGAIALTGWFGALHDYQRQRVLTFLNPQADPLGAGYNVRQAIVAIGSGGWFGRGLGLGTQSQLNFLPEQETDFIFASLAEELGFLGASAVILLYLFFFWRMYQVLQGNRSLFGSFVAIGIISMFLIQSVINIGMNMGIFPVTGVPLPFVSYGGSSLLLGFLSIGILQNLRK